MKKRARLTVDMDPALKRRLAIYAAEHGYSLSEVAARMIESGMARWSTGPLAGLERKSARKRSKP